MSNPPPQRERTPIIPQPQKRQVAVPGAAKQQRRGGLLLLGLVLVAGAGFGFWFTLQSIDQRADYLVTARTIERWEVARAAHFDVVEANVGTASAMTVDQAGNVLGKWATGRIPAGTLVTEGLFESPPLSSDSDKDRVLIEVQLPPEDAAFDSLATGDKVALVGVQPSELEGQTSDVGLIGVLSLEFVQGDGTIIYLVSPEEALQIEQTVQRYMASSDRRIWKLGFDLRAEDLSGVLGELNNAVAAPGDLFDELGSSPEPVEEP